MKQLLVICAIAMAMKISLITATDGAQLDTKDFNDPVVFYKSAKQLAEKFEPLVKQVIEELPQEEETYGKHREALENYLLKSQETKATPEICFIKVFKMLEDFIDVVAPYKHKTDDVAVEDLKVLELFNQHGYTELEKKLLDLVLQYDAVEFSKRVASLNPEVGHELLGVCER